MVTYQRLIDIIIVWGNVATSESLNGQSIAAGIHYIIIDDLSNTILLWRRRRLVLLWIKWGSVCTHIYIPPWSHSNKCMQHTYKFLPLLPLPNIRLSIFFMLTYALNPLWHDVDDEDDVYAAMVSNLFLCKCARHRRNRKATLLFRSVVSPDLYMTCISSFTELLVSLSFFQPPFPHRARGF